MSEFKYIGKNIAKEDNLSRVIGETKYSADIKRKDMLYARLVLSTKANATFELNTKKALELKGVVAIYSYENSSKVPYNSSKWYPGFSAREDETMFCKKALYVGDRIAMVVAESDEIAKQAVSLVEIKYKESTPTLSLKDAKANTNIIKDDSNLAFSKELVAGDYEAVSKKADILVEDIGSTSKLHHAAMESHVCLAEIDDFGGLVVTVPCQVAFQVRMLVSNVLGIATEKVRVIKANMGGSFGGKSLPILEPLCAYAAFTLKRPVVLNTSRSQTMLTTMCRNASEMHISTALSKDGRVLGRKLVADVDIGAYFTNASLVTSAIGKKFFRLYDIQDQTYHGSAYYTNTTVGGAMRAYGSPQLHSITEVNMDSCARALNMDPCEFRLKNLVSPGAKDPTGGMDIGQGDVKKCLTEGMKAFDWSNRFKNVKQKNDERYAYGVGVACATHPNGYKGAFPDFTQVIASVESNGRVLIKVSVHEQGCGTIGSLKQIAAEALDIPYELITLTEVDTALTPYDSAGTQASRVTFVSGGAIKEACEKLKVVIVERLCQIRGLKPNEVTFENGSLKLANGEVVTLADVAIQAEDKLKNTVSVYTNYESPANPASFAVSFVEVKVDKYTGHVDILDFLAVHDIGRVINHVFAEGQIKGGMQFAMGMALHEKLDFDSNGRLKSLNFSKYHLVNAVEMPEVRCMFIENGEPHAPFGAKSVGELACIAPAPAIINAINNAIDTRITHYPATPEVIIAALTK